MLAVRVKAEVGVLTFTGSAQDVEAIYVRLAQTGNDTFMFESKDANGKSGKIIRRANNGAKPKQLYHFINHINYCDGHWECYGTQTWCEEQAKQTNDKREGWWSISASVSRVAGNLWHVYYTDPYKD